MRATTWLAAMVLAAAVLLPGAAEAKGAWYTGEGQVLVANISPEEARRQALEQARRDAIEKASLEVAGVDSRVLREQKGKEAYDTFASFTQSISRGRIVEEEILRDEMAMLDLGAGARPMHVVQLRAKVVTSGEPDPSFVLRMKTNETTFRPGEKLHLTLTASQDCYVTLLNLYGGDSLRVLMPGTLAPVNFLAAGETLHMPPEGAGWSWTMEPLASGDVSQEALLAIGTKKPIPFTMETTLDYDQPVAMDNALMGLNRWLVEIPRDQWTQAMVAFTILP
jgi:hypothetical protein